MFDSGSIKLPRPAVNTIPRFKRIGNRIIHSAVLMFAGFALALLTAATASAQTLNNPGFEQTPDLNGWSLSTGGVGSAPTTLGGVVNPTEGSRFGFITTAGTTNTVQYGGFEGTILTQTFSAEEGDTITLDYNFLTNEFAPDFNFNDFGRGELLDGTGAVMLQIFNADTTSNFVRASGSGYSLQTGWQTAQIIVPATGTYTLRFIVSDVGDAVGDSGLALDNIRLAARPRLIISEYRLRGPNGANDEFVELYNATPDPITVSTTDGSLGWALVSSNGSTKFIVPNGTVIPGRGHYLGVNTGGYSLSNYPAAEGTTATGDATYTGDIADGSGLALFRTADPVRFNTLNRLDAVGYSTSPSLYREGNGFPTGGAETTTNLQYSFVRDMVNGPHKDTNSNVSDFISVEVGGTATAAGQRLGAPGPENLSSPLLRTNLFSTALVDPQQSSAASPNRVRIGTPVPNGAYGTMEIRRGFVNNTGGNVTRLRFRLVDVTTFPVASNVADLRGLSSADIFVTRTDGTSVPVRGTTLEEPPAQPNGGGINATLSAGAVTLATPLAPGDTIYVRFLLGVQQSGSYRFLVNVEALP